MCESLMQVFICKVYMQKVILLVCKYIFKFQDSKKIIIGVDMFSAMSKEHASYTSIYSA